ncbi:hypothetical protein [Gallaecimonas mangrovi]|uniref:hypothetical protein n=1 Tax=Gallaecimonas mangrovi TaxID=2291597 RepID=UPI000E1FDA1F|nr:hypothetical protein [Gallaecimonas mangrovi]
MDALSRFFAQRQAMLQSGEADLGLLKLHDRRLLGALAQGQLGPASAQGLDAESLLALLPAHQDAMAFIEARERIWPGELLRLQQALCQLPSGQTLAWWLAGCYPALMLPKSPGGWLQARAYWLRQQSATGDWALWSSAQKGEKPLAKVVVTLWEQSQGQQWQYWLTPLWQQAPTTQVVASINVLAAKVDEITLVNLMGRSHLGRFLPWLGTLHQQELAEAVLDNQLYLSGGSQKAVAERQCWGEALNAAWLTQLPQQLMLKYRSRLWGLVTPQSRGAPWSLFGGQLCLGSLA